ncbi:MAG: ABC transporter permease [Alphaproteobacteria bacterium]|nr:ABC transporter permease [Alphaproteobacteria bacterium]
MLALLGRKLVEAILVGLIISFVTFLLVTWTGDLAIALGGLGASREELQQLRTTHGLDRPILVQYLDWAAKALSGDLGRSFFSKEDVLPLILSRLPVTATLAVCSIGVGIALALPLGILAAIRQGRWIDHTAQSVAAVSQAMPSFWSGLLLILLFGVNLQVLPISGYENWASFVMPSLALGWFVFPILLRLLRAGMVETLNTDYIRTARAKGLSPRRIILKHALRNAVLPVISLAAVQFGQLLGGSVVIEAVFALPGVGQLAWNSIQRADFPVVQAIVLLVAVIFVTMNLLADLINGALDPRIRRA